MPETPQLPSLNVSVAPHIRYTETVPSIMLSVAGALAPALIAAVYFFGMKALFLTAVCVASSILTEWLIVRFMLHAENSLGDYSALVTGLLVAFNLPVDLPWWMAAVGSAFAIGVAKMTFGGLGNNFINPALAGRAFLMASFPASMTSWAQTNMGSLGGIDGITTATPLAALKEAVAQGNFQALEFQDALSNLFFGNVGGCIGETSALALILGAIFLVYKRIIGLSIPGAYIGTVFLLSWGFNGTGAYFTSDALIIPVYHVLAGGLLLGALFMATDMVTSPITPMGKIIFGIGCGVLTFMIRKFGGYPEGVSYSILLMNLVSPLIDRYTRPRIYGKVKKRG